MGLAGRATPDLDPRPTCGVLKGNVTVLSPSDAPKPAREATLLLVAGLLISAWFTTGETSSAIARAAAIGAGISLAISLLVDLRGNLRNLVRADVMALGSLYFLTLFEFLFPQPDFDDLVSTTEVGPAVTACYLAFGALAIGRHIAPRPAESLSRVLQHDFPPRLLLIIFWIAMAGGYFYMLVAVNFDVPLMIDYLMAPRFSQPWTRGRLGDWRALVGELGMIVNLVPPVAGIILAQRRRYSTAAKVGVAAGFLFTLFAGFAGGTRNVLATYLATFLVAYAFTVEAKRRKEVIILGACVAGIFYVASNFMLEFRNIGLANYLDHIEAGEKMTKQTTLFVDYNLFVIAKLIQVFPSQHDFLGFEIPYLALIRPIPRALWSGKPEGMSLSIEEVFGAEGMTLASSFVGEAYMSGGFIGIVVTGLILGSIIGWWNRLGRSDNSPFGYLVFASGFFTAVISMRSLFVFTTAILPTVAALVIGQWLISRYRHPR